METSIGKGENNLKTGYLAIRTKSGQAWYSAPEIQNIQNVAALLSSALNDDEATESVAAFEKHLGTGWSVITEEEHGAAARRFRDDATMDLMVELDFTDDYANISNHAPGRTLVCNASGAISRLAGIYEMSLNQKTGSVSQDAFVKGLLEHFSVETVAFDKPQIAEGMTMQ